MSSDPIAPVLAYLGPGGALSAVGSFLALLGAVILAVIGFVWYPVKRFVRSRRARRAGVGTIGPVATRGNKTR
jgi:uncharacterized membrane protein